MDATRELAAYEHASSLEVVGRDLHRMLERYPETRAKGEVLVSMNREIRRAREALDAFEAIVARESRDVREAAFIVSFSTGEAA